MATKQTIEIQRLLVDGVKQSEIAQRFGISRGRVHQIKKKLLDPINRHENKIEFDTIEVLAKGGNKLAGKLGGYLQDGDTKQFRKI